MTVDIWVASCATSGANPDASQAAITVACNPVACAAVYMTNGSRAKSARRTSEHAASGCDEGSTAMKRSRCTVRKVASCDWRSGVRTMPMSSASSCSMAIIRTDVASDNTSSTPGYSLRKGGMSAGMTRWIADPTNPIRKRPPVPAAASRALRISCSPWYRSRRASISATLPLAVSTTPDDVRSNSLVPSSLSSFWIDTDNAGCAICSRSAARLKLSVSASTLKWRIRRRSIWRSSMPHGHRRTTSSAIEPGRAFLDECVHRLRMVRGLVRYGLINGGQLEDRIESRVEAFAYQPFREPKRMTGVGRDATGHGAGGIHELAMRHNPGNEIPGERLLRIDHVSRECQLRRSRQTDDARQQPRTAITRHDAELDEALGKFRLLRGDADVAHAREVQPGPERMAVDCGDHRNLQVEKGQRKLLDSLPVLLADGHFRNFRTRLSLHRADVAAGRERRTVSGEDHAAHPGVSLDSRNCRHEFDGGRISGERVALLRLVHRQQDYGALLFVNQEIGHGLLAFMMRRAFGPPGASSNTLCSSAHPHRL